MVAAVINLFAMRMGYAGFFGRPHRRSHIERRMIHAIRTLRTSRRLLHDACRADPARGLRKYRGGGLRLSLNTGRS